MFGSSESLTFMNATVIPSQSTQNRDSQCHGRDIIIHTPLKGRKPLDIFDSWKMVFPLGWSIFRGKLLVFGSVIPYIYMTHHDSILYVFPWSTMFISFEKKKKPKMNMELEQGPLEKQQKIDPNRYISWGTPPLVFEGVLGKMVIFQPFAWTAFGLQGTTCCLQSCIVGGA